MDGLTRVVLELITIFSPLSNATFILVTCSCSPSSRRRLGRSGADGDCSRHLLLHRRLRPDLPMSLL